MNVLANGPMSTAIIEELGAARKFSKKQLWRAKQRIGAVAFKKKGKLNGGWLWSLPQNAPKQSSTAKLGYTRRTSQPRKIAGLSGFGQSAKRQAEQVTSTFRPISPTISKIPLTA